MDNRDQSKNRHNKFVSALKAVFVHNIGWKLLALASSLVIWVLAAGLW